MKTTKNILGLLLALVVTLTFSSCEKNVVYEPAEKLDSEQVFFPSSNPNALDISLEATSLDITLARVNTEGVLTVDLDVTVAKVVAGDDEDEGEVEDAKSVLNIPSSVTFEDGEATAILTVSYDPADFEYEDFYNVVITIVNNEESTPYGIHSYEVKIGLPAPWESLGTATYQDDLITGFFGVDNLIYEVEIQEHALKPGLYRLVNPYGEAYPNNDEGDWDDSRDWYLEINAEDPECVYMLVQNTGMNWGYGNIHVGSIGGLRKAQGWTNEKIKAEGLAGTLVDGVISFPENVMIIGMEEYKDFGLYMTNGNGLTRVALPGSVLADYTLEIAYAGKYTNIKDEAIGAMCMISESGEDIETIRIALVQGTDVDAAIKGMLDETIETVLVKRTDGYFPDAPIMVPFAEDPEDGKYTLVAIGFNSEKEAQAYAASEFKFTSSTVKETWTAKFIGSYEYSLFFEGVDDETVLYQSDTDPNRWKLADWGGGVDFVFTFDQSTGDINVLEQEIGYVHSSYGTVYVMELADYSKDTAGFPTSYYEDGEFNFALIYFVNGGYFDYGFETYTLTAAASVKGFAPTKQKASAASLIKAKFPTVKSMTSHKELKRNVSSFKSIR